MKGCETKHGSGKASNGTREVYESMEGDRVPFPTPAYGDADEDRPADKVPSSRCDGCSENPMVFLFQLVFKSSQKPDTWRTKMQDIFAKALFIALGIQTLWAMFIITWIIVFNNTIVTSNNMPFISLLVTSILGEVVAMVFFVVRYVFKSPISELIDVLNEVLKNGSK